MTYNLPHIATKKIEFIEELSIRVLKSCIYPKSVHHNIMLPSLHLLRKLYPPLCGYTKFIPFNINELKKKELNTLEYLMR